MVYGIIKFLLISILKEYKLNNKIIEYKLGIQFK